MRDTATNHHQTSLCHSGRSRRCYLQHSRFPKILPYPSFFKRRKCRISPNRFLYQASPFSSLPSSFILYHLTSPSSTPLLLYFSTFPLHFIQLLPTTLPAFKNKNSPHKAGCFENNRKLCNSFSERFSWSESWNFLCRNLNWSTSFRISFNCSCSFN